MSRRSRNTARLNTDVNDLFNTSDPVQFEKKLSDIIKKYDKLLAQEKLREEYNKRILNHSLTIGTINDGILRNYINQNNQIETNNKSLSETLSIVRDITTGLASGLNWLDGIDGAIKTANLTLGRTRGMAIGIRDNLLDVGGFAASIGASMESVLETQTAYNNSLSRNVMMSKEAMKSLISISKGLGLSNEFSGEIAANFERLGYSAENVGEFIEGAVVSSGKMGVNVNKVLTTMNTAFNRANTFNFSKGISAFKEMAEYSEKYRVSIESAFSSMEVARTLEGAVEMAAKLMVMGGQFAKQNPFELSFLARNRPEEYTKKINEMTRGVYYFNEQTKQFQSSAFELDRLRASADALGVPFNELNDQAMRLAQMDMAKSKLLGFSPADKELISSMATLNKDTGQFTIDINGNPTDIRNLTNQAVESYREMTASLEARSQEAMMFNDQYNVFINEFKALFLPFIKTMNTVGTFINQLPDSVKMLIGGIAVVVPLFSGLIVGMGAVVASIRSMIPSLAASSSGAGRVAPTANPMSGAGGRGFSMNLTGAATALATGAAFMMFAKGVQMIADAYKDLDTDKIEQLNWTIGVGGASMAASILAVGLASKIAGPGLGILGLSMLGVGAGAALFGVGVMAAANGIGNLIEKVTAVDTSSIIGLGAGIGAISLGIASFANPFTVAGMVGFGAFVGLLTLAKKPLNDLGTSLSSLNSLSTMNFTGINTVLDKIQNLKTSDNGIVGELRGIMEELKNFDSNVNFVSELKKVLSQPLKLEFDKSSLNQKIDLNVYLDSDVVYRKLLTRLPKSLNLISTNRMNDGNLKTHI